MKIISGTETKDVNLLWSNLYVGLARKIINFCDWVEKLIYNWSVLEHIFVTYTIHLQDIYYVLEINSYIKPK